MVCPRCIYIVENELFMMGIKIYHIELGIARVSVPEHVSPDDIDERLIPFGFRVLRDKNEIIVETVKKKINSYISDLENKRIRTNISTFLSRELGRNYNYLSKLFTKYEWKTVEDYYIEKKIERIKQLMVEDELNISEIASQLGYSSVHYLSNQFKQHTGFTPKQYKNRFRSQSGS